jgi:hypothetical protein
VVVDVYLQKIHKFSSKEYSSKVKKRASDYLKTNCNIEFFLNGIAGQGSLSAPIPHLFSITRANCRSTSPYTIPHYEHKNR